MPRTAPPILSSIQCSHNKLQLLPSSHANEAGYRRPRIQARKAECLKPKKTSRNVLGSTSRGKKELGVENGAGITTFSSPLVLPGDDISLDPGYPPQSFESWIRDEDRNDITSRKNVVYVAAPPNIDNEVSFIEQWDTPRTKCNTSATTPDIDDVLNYLKAFYHGLPVKLFPKSLSFTSWESGGTRGLKSKSKPEEPRYVGFNIGTQCVRIRTRASPDEIFPRQLNLDDLLDAVISMLPKDAYALILLVKQDLYESADDIFVCGRAYGGSRVAVVSTSRYNPILDGKHNVDREHSWPASHCQDYVKSCVDASRPKKRTKCSNYGQNIVSDKDTSSPLPAALLAHKSLPPLKPFPTTTQLSGLWLGRVCRTASHELGHCFGIDHCMYYACSMQGSASLTEDTRQPPYLCHVDLAKMLHATGTTAKDRYLSLLSFCKRHDETHLFAAFGAWINSRLDNM
ncbi:hypothetical protein EMCG_00194 [[Emmonsia] crescens]|uniref:Uncharacterized protein n=1 Tax=[Emmonsia] crescens TaxID=73230 RepID=A0A0G2JB03_9EURO|nr:hypothetical protein EMCG_00194 [Emmonsia crescens UAMH 3008]